MRIALNAHLLSFGPSYRGAGISRYAQHLLGGLRQRDGEDRFVAFFGDRRLPASLSAAGSFEPRVSRLPTVNPIVRMLWEQLWQPVELHRHGIDVLHSLGYVQPLCCACRSVVTVHDLSFLLYPQAFNPQNRAYLRLFTRMSVKRANRVIAVSESTKRDIVRLLGVSADKVDVVYHAVEDDFRPRSPGEIDQFRRSEGLPDKFILYCGTLEPRKNVDNLIAAYAILRRQAHLPHKLVLAGAKGWRYEHIFAAVERQGLSNDVIFPGYLASATQPLWYNAADLFAYPSLYEGFGFPPLEAMACGTPVVALNRSSLPEVLGEAALLADSPDAESLAKSMRLVLTEPGLRESMIEVGLRRARQFSWDRAIRETVAVYHTA